MGTASIETSEYLSGLLKKENIFHQVLNAKFHESEAQIIAEAGRPGAVTIATNMAGRGTDIVLGGKLESDEDKTEWQKRHDAVVASGGLHIIGSERHESRRIDNQLRGRSGRQGDPGSTRFYLSLEDNLMRIFAADRLKNIMQTLGMKEDEAIVSPLVSRAIENAQHKVEARNFDIRKQLLEYDDVANEQRKVIYEQRTEVLGAEDVAETIKAIRTDVIKSVIDNFIPPDTLEEQWNIPGLQQTLSTDFALSLSLHQWLEEDENLHEETLKQKILEISAKTWDEKVEQVGAETMRQVEKSVMLQQLDHLWKEHLAQMDHLRQGIHLRGYAQKNPKQEYKREAFNLFTEMLDKLKYQVTNILSNVKIQTPEEIQLLEALRRSESEMPLQLNHPGLDEVAAFSPSSTAIPMKVGRNEPCPCGSGKKFKQCHGLLIHA